MSMLAYVTIVGPFVYTQILYRQVGRWFVEEGFCSLRTSPSSGQATSNSLLRHPNLPACLSGAALYGFHRPIDYSGKIAARHDA
jgi:hypothetical protein